MWLDVVMPQVPPEACFERPLLLPREFAGADDSKTSREAFLDGGSDWAGLPR